MPPVEIVRPSLVHDKVRYLVEAIPGAYAGKRNR